MGKMQQQTQFLFVMALTTRRARLKAPLLLVLELYYVINHHQTAANVKPALTTFSTTSSISDFSAASQLHCPDTK